MKNSIKTLTILVVMFLFSNSVNSATYTYNNGSWSGTTPTLSSLTASDIIIISNSGTNNSSLTISSNITVNEIRLTSGSSGSSTLNHTAGTITGKVTSTGNNARLSGAGTTITSTVTVSSGVLTVGNAKTASSWILSGGTLTNNAALTGPITTSNTVTLNGSNATVGAVTVTGGTLTVSAAKTATSWTLSGGNLTNSADITGSITMSSSRTLGGTGSVGVVTTTGGTLTVSAAKTAASWILNGGNLTNNAAIGGPITVTSSATLAGSNSSVGAVTISSGATLSVGVAKTAASWTLNGGNLTNTNTISGAITVSASGTINSSNTNPAITISNGTLTFGTNITTSSVSMTGGSLNVGSNTLIGSITVIGVVTITSQTTLPAITISAGTLTLGSAITTSSVNMTGGSLNIGDYNLIGNIAASVSGTISAGTGALQNITISGGTLTAGSNLDINDLTMSGGNLYLSDKIVTTGGNITISANGTLSSSGTGILFNNGNNTDINGGTLTIDSAELITEDLEFFTDNNFIVTTHSGLMSFDNKDNTGISGANKNRHVNGTIRVYMDNSSKGADTYPIGNGSFYAPIEIDPNGKNNSNSNLSSVTPSYGTHYIDIKYVGAKHMNTIIDTSLKSASGSEYWNISTSSTNPAATFRFFVNSTGTTYGQTSVSGSDITTALELALYNSSINKWVQVPATVATVTGGYSVRTNAVITPNTAFTFGSKSTSTTFLTPLPVSLIDFSAKANANNIEVKWSTASEKDNASFVVEKSIDGLVWSSIATVKGAKNSNVVNNYGVLDYKAVAGFQYYRLKQIDLDGTVNYSKAIAVNFSKVSTLNVNLFPNPAKDALNITTENNATGEVNIQILNSMGETVYNQVVEAGLVQTIDIASFIPGVYYVTVIAEGESKIIRLLKN